MIGGSVAIDENLVENIVNHLASGSAHCEACVMFVEALRRSLGAAPVDDVGAEIDPHVGEVNDDGMPPELEGWEITGPVTFTRVGGGYEVIDGDNDILAECWSGDIARFLARALNGVTL